MKSTFTILLTSLCIILSQASIEKGSLLKNIENEVAAGNFQKANHLADSIKMVYHGDTLLAERLDSLKDLTHRIQLDFSLSEAEVDERLQKIMGQYTHEDKLNWEKQKLLEYRIIDGEKRYFNRSVSNLKLLLDFRIKKSVPFNGYTPDETASFRIREAQETIDSSGGNGTPVKPVNIRIRYKITVKADAVPQGEIIRCWMPFPQERHARQQSVKLIRTTPERYILSSDSVGQRSLYLEQQAVDHQPAIFEMELTYRPYAQYFDLASLPVKPYQTTSPLYLQYISEEKPHIVFTEKIRKLSDSIVGNEKRPLEIIRKIYNWIDENIPWAGALEYSTIPNIPEYVMVNRHGDCGMKTLLFMTLARYSGIPVKWQSGWNMSPGNIDMHDWCEVWHEGIGWVPLDMDFGRLPDNHPKIREYYMSGIDAYRLIVNDATGSPFQPSKKFLRSEPVDFQRGEVEWKGGNLYFDKWNYKMEVEYY